MLAYNILFSFMSKIFDAFSLSLKGNYLRQWMREISWYLMAPMGPSSESSSNQQRTSRMPYPSYWVLQEISTSAPAATSMDQRHVFILIRSDQIRSDPFIKTKYENIRSSFMINLQVLIKGPSLWGHGKTTSCPKRCYGTSFSPSPPHHPKISKALLP